ncbi:metallophosphoesterase [Fundicoccus sp. Sow4_F4]|uniref:metallophosphoesterase n=1 Tax=Fundicoccus sp. Sow4_F4 TaxID=3438783 RepID=UPI003F93D076
MKKSYLITSAVATALGVFMIAGLNSKLLTRKYTMKSSLIDQDVQIVYISDLHNNYYGEDHEILKEAITALKPDLILLGGDIFEVKQPLEPAASFIRWIGAHYQAYYVTGNHEYYSYRVSEMRQLVMDSQIKVLRGDTDVIEVNGNRLAISGIDDAEESHVYPNQLIQAQEQRPSEPTFSILLSHRPEFIEDFLPYQFNLILSGHAHGGQWRVPGLINGVFAPGQGMFPKYAGGRFAFDHSTLIVSRGLSYQDQPAPRFYNRPELVSIQLVSDAE